MDNQRFILFIALSVIILLLWQAWESEKQAASPTTATRQEVPSAPEAPTPAAPARPGQIAVEPKIIEHAESIEITTDLVHAVINTQGGDLRMLELIKHPVSIDKPDVPFRLLDEQINNLNIAQSGLIARSGALPNHKTRYSVDAHRYTLAPGQDKLEVRLHWTSPDGLQATKIYTFHRNEYLIDVRFDIKNSSRTAREIYLYAQFLRQYVEQSMSFTTLPTYTGGVIFTQDKKYEKISYDDIKDKPLARDAVGGWVAMLQHYFLGAWLPGEKDNLQFYSDTYPGQKYILGYKTLAPLNIAPGQAGSIGTRLFVGPKEQQRLDKIDETLTLTVDYGWLTFIAAPLFWLLEWFHKLVGNWGWAIILLTLLIKLVFYPLSVVSYRSMAHMRKLQPRLQSLKERYGDDKQKMQQAMMEIYKTEKINPLGGCLPILVQIPVFIALYWVLLESVELRQAPFILWLRDLSIPDPYFVLPVLMGVTMLGQTWLNPQPLDPMQKKIMYALPAVFTVMFLFFPSGLVLYWVVQNIISIAQQWQINRSIEGKAK